MKEALIGAVVTVLIFAVSVIYRFGRRDQAVDQKDRDIEQLKKELGREIEDLRKKVEGIDNWSRKHEEDAGRIRMELSEKISGIESAVRITNQTYQENMRLIERVEGSIEKMDARFADLSDKVNEIILRMGWERRTSA